MLKAEAKMHKLDTSLCILASALSISYKFSVSFTLRQNTKTISFILFFENIAYLYIFGFARFVHLYATKQVEHKIFTADFYVSPPSSKYSKSLPLLNSLFHHAH